MSRRDPGEENRDLLPIYRELTFLKKKTIDEITAILEYETKAEIYWWFMDRHIPRIIVPTTDLEKKGFFYYPVIGVNGSNIVYSDKSGSIEYLDLDSINFEELLDIYESLHDDVYGKEKKDQ